MMLSFKKNQYKYLVTLSLPCTFLCGYAHKQANEIVNGGWDEYAVFKSANLVDF